MDNELRFTTLDTVVRDVCSMMGDAEFKEYVRVARLGRHVLQELNLLAIPSYRSDWYTIGSSFTVALPSDCIQPTKVGTLDNNGRINLFGTEDRLRIQLDNELDNPVSCDNPDLDHGSTTSTTTINASTAGSGVWFSNVNSRGEYIGELYGLRQRPFTNGVYRYDKERNLIEFGVGSAIYEGQQVIIEYKAALGEDQYKLIPVEWSTAIMYRTLQHLDAFKRANVSQVHFRQFLREWATIKRQAQAKPIKEWVAAIEQARYGSPKW